MNPTSTQEQLIRFIYHECTPKERHAISRAIHEKEELAQEYAGLKRLQEHLNSEYYEPSQTSIDIIMQHVHSAVHH